MNTKYPLNGRIATLADLVHEYGPISGWVGNTSSYDTKYDLLSINDSSTQPFQKLIFKDQLNNNKFSAEIPYEIVYFDNVYSTTQKDDSGKQMKIIQQNDTSAFGENTYGWLSGSSYVNAGIVSNPTNIKQGYFGFKFIGASIDDHSIKKNQYYYNYKTSQGEATVMYAFRNILDILYKYDYKKNNNSKHDIISDFFMTDYPTDSSAFFKDVNINDLINFNTKPYLPQIYAYKYLGDAVWTSKHVQYENYVSIEKNSPIIAKAKSLKYLDAQQYQEFNMLKKHIWKLLGLSQNQAELDNNYSYNNVSVLNKLLYFFHIFLDSQRFFVSFVTSFRFIKISNKSYLQTEPVLRCDLGLFALYKSVTIKEAVHDYRTALPQDNILLTTKLDIIIKYVVKYENISSISSDITTTINLTWADVIKYSEDKKNSIWFSLRTCVYEDPNSTNYIKFKNDTKKFGQYQYGTSPFLTIDHSSLGILAWPENESLILTDDETFNAIKNNPTYSKNNIKNYANTADIKTFKNSSTNTDIYNDVKTRIIGQYSPFGTLRMHNYLDSENEKSEYWCDVDLYRCKNFYIIQDNDSLSNISMNIYYSIPYLKIQPITYIPLVNMTFDEAGTDDSNKAVKDKPDNILALYDKAPDLKQKIIYSIPNDPQKDVYIVVSTTSSKRKLYASGESEPIKNTGSDMYVNNLNIVLYYLDSEEIWQLATENKDYYINNQESSDETLKYYRFHLINPNNNYVFWKFKFDDIKEFLYFKITNIITTSKIQLQVITIHVYDDNGATIESRVKGNDNTDISLQYLVYHDDNTTQQYKGSTTRLNYFIQAFNNSTHTTINKDVYINNGKDFYIEPISFKMFDKYYYQQFSGGLHSPFNVAYRTGQTANNKQIYKFIQSSTLFGDNIENRRVKIDSLEGQTQPKIYLSLEPLYIFEFGTITFSEEKDVKTGKKYVEDTCKIYYDNKFKLHLFKYKINSGGNFTSLKLDQDVNIFSLYTQLIYFDSDLLVIDSESNTIYNDLYNITTPNQKTTEGYLMSYEIHVLYYDNKKSEYIENDKSPVIISNGFSKAQIDNNLNNITLQKNTQYLININFTLFQKRTGQIACTFGHSDSRYSSLIQIKVTALPEGYVGDGSIQKDTVFVGDNRPIQLPIGCTIEIIDKFEIPDGTDVKDMKWLGWKTTYDTDYVTSEETFHRIVKKIQPTPDNISIISVLFVSNKATVEQVPSTGGGGTTGGN